MSDDGKYFQSDEIEKFLEKLKIEDNSSNYPHPQGNSTIEEFTAA